MSIETKIRQRTEGLGESEAITTRKNELRELVKLARINVDDYIEIFNKVGTGETHQDAIIAATDLDVGSLKTNLHGLSSNTNIYTVQHPRDEPDPLGLNGSLNATIAHFAVLSSDEASIALMADLYELYKGRNGFRDFEMKQNSTIILAGLKTEGGRTVFQVAYMIHESIRDYIKKHTGFEQFLSKLEIL